MTPEEESSKPEGTAAPGKRLRPRRSRRGGRGRGRKPVQPASEIVAGPEPPHARAEAAEVLEAADTAVEPVPEEAPLPDSPIEEARREAAEASLSEQREDREHSEEHSARPERRDFRPAAPVAIGEAITLVTHILTSLQRVLDEMEEVLETLELAEVQKNADEREIQALLSALRQFERRGPELRHEPQSGPRDPRPRDRGPRRHGRR